MSKCVLFYILFSCNAVNQPSDTVIKWSKDRRLTYADFWSANSGKSNDPEIRPDTLATIDCTIGYDIKTSPEKYSIHAYGAMYPRKSWIAVKDPEVLRHEQTHFDITEIYARKLERLANDTVIKDMHTYYYYLMSVYKQVTEELKEEQDKYDEWWRNAFGKAYYSKWANAELFSPTEATAGGPVRFTSAYEKDGDKIRIDIGNNSNDTLYYYIGLSGIVDTGKISLTTDIKAFSQDMPLYTLTPQGKASELLSKKQILGKFPAYGIRKLQFYIVYYRRPDLRSDCEVVHLPGI